MIAEASTTLPTSPPAAAAIGDALQRPDAAHFAAPVCRNCDAPCATPCCSQCGQPRVRRLGRWQVGVDIWDEWGPFGLDFLRSAWRLLCAPGIVAREYVLGARRRHVNPFKLLLIGIAVFLLVVNHGDYLAARDAEISRAMVLMQAWANGSFSLNLLAFGMASWLLFRRRCGYNLVEHLVLASYAQFVVLCISIISKLPTLLFRDPAFIELHRGVSPWMLGAAGVAVVVAGFTQFFGLDWRRDGMRLLAAVAAFVALKLLLTRAYGELIVHVVRHGAT